MCLPPATASKRATTQPLINVIGAYLTESGRRSSGSKFEKSSFLRSPAGYLAHPCSNLPYCYILGCVAVDLFSRALLGTIFSSSSSACQHIQSHRCHHITSQFLSILCVVKSRVLFYIFDILSHDIHPLDPWSS